MTTIDETIECCEEIAEDLEEREKRARGADWKYANYCKERAENNRQLAEWLKDYKRLLSAVDDIKAEIEKNIVNEYTGQNEYEIAMSDGLEIALKIIYKYTNGEEK